MKIKVTKSDVTVLAIQLGVWLCILLTPALINFVMTLDAGRSVSMFVSLFTGSWYSFLVYFLNFYLFVPFLLFPKRWVWFILANALFTAIPCIRFLMLDTHQTPEYVPQVPVLMVFIGIAFYNILIMGCAFGARSFLRWKKARTELQEQQQKTTEAELAWLKNQLNPHFLFNTLNNISALVHIDADAATESIGQLSDLLRYALYETRNDTVPLGGEVEFMQNYIDLMKLRCNSETTRVETCWELPEQPLPIAPLLFISLIENAFKHGVSNSEPSFVSIRLEAREGDILFACTNSNYPKSDANRSGSGVGLENMRRRLDLLYPGRYSYRHWLEGNDYHAEIRLKEK